MLLSNVAVCCSVLQCVAVRCSALQCVFRKAANDCCADLPYFGVLTYACRTKLLADVLEIIRRIHKLSLCVIKCCSVLQCVAVCRSVSQCVVVCCSVLRCVAVCHSVLQCVAVICSVRQCAAGCWMHCSLLQCVAVCCSVLQCATVRCNVLQCCSEAPFKVKVRKLYVMGIQECISHRYYQRQLSFKNAFSSSYRY